MTKRAGAEGKFTEGQVGRGYIKCKGKLTQKLFGISLALIRLWSLTDDWTCLSHEDWVLSGGGKTATQLCFPHLTLTFKAKGENNSW